MIKWFRKRNPVLQYKRGYIAGYRAGSRESTEFLRQMLVKNLLNDSLITTNADTVIVERVVQIVEAS